MNELDLTKNVGKTYQTILFHDEESLRALIHQEIFIILGRKAENSKEETVEPTKIFTSSEAAAFLKMKPQSLIRARARGGIKGKLINGREYGYEYIELKNYTRGAHKKIVKV